MWGRGLVALAFVLAGVPAAAVAAPGHAPSQTCTHLISDPRGNAQMWFLPTKPYNADADLLYLDAHATAKTVVFTITMASVNPTPASGTAVTVYFTSNEQSKAGDWYVTVDHQIDGTTYVLQDNTTQALTALTGSVNTAAGTYTVSVPRTAIYSGYRGATLRNLGVVVSQELGTTKANGGFTEQSTGAQYHYKVGFPYTCAKTK